MQKKREQVHIPFSCAVYFQEQRGPYFKFSHFCSTKTSKIFPPSLRVKDLRAYDQKTNESTLLKACFVVLVSGDVAQCVTVANASDKNRIRFLYSGSVFDKSKIERRSYPEIDDNYIPVPFYATMGLFDTRHTFHTAISVESGVSLFPTRIKEQDLPLIAKWARGSIQKSLTTSIWVTFDGKSYNETSRVCSRGVRVNNEIFNHVIPHKRRKVEIKTQSTV